MNTRITSSGRSGTGQTGTQEATLFMPRSPAAVTRVHANEGGTNIAYAAENADLIIVHGGYSDFPAFKKIIGMGINADYHLIATEPRDWEKYGGASIVQN